MANSPSFFHRLLLCALCATALLASAQPACGQDDYEAERKRAFALIEENKFPDALPILEKLTAAKPDDALVVERLALAVAVTASSKKNPEEVVQDLKRARALAVKAKALGNEGRIVQMLLQRIPENVDAASAGVNRKRSPAEEELMEGERAFGSGDMKAALAHYEKAAQLDPKLYDAPLFIGDVYFKQGKIEQAGEAYAHAIAIDPNRETAYRYWGNVLMQNGRMKEAKEKLIDAVIAEPYNRAPWQFLAGWGQRNQIQVGHPRIEVPQSSVKRKDDKNIDLFVTASGKDDGSDIWMVYSIAKAGWMTGDAFKKEFPNEAAYRRSLPEEAMALRLAAEGIETRLKEGKLKESALDVSLANLRKLHRAGLIEPYILFAMADEGIARDYEAYRKEHRDKLRQYLNEIVTAK